MRNLAVFIAIGWGALLFYGAGPLNTPQQFAIGGGALAIGCVAFALCGMFNGRRRAKPASVRPDRLAP